MARRREQFDRKHRWLTASAYLLHAHSRELEKELRTAFDSEIEAIGYSTAAGETWLRGLFIDRAQAEIILDDFSGFLRLTCEQTVIAAFRALIDYMNDLLIDIARDSPDKVAHSIRDKIIKRKLVASDFPGAFRKLGLRFPDAHGKRFELLRQTRNLVEHHDGVISADYVKVAGCGTAGETLVIDGDFVSTTLGFTRELVVGLESTATHLKLIEDGFDGLLQFRAMKP